MQEKEYLEILYKSIIPKLITWIGSDTPTNLENYFSQNNPFKHLNYPSEEAYLQEKNLTQESVIESSIKYIHHDIKDDELKFLIQSFKALVQHKNLKILNVNTGSEVVIYSEIISYLEYVKKIQLLINKGRSDKLGTAFRTSSLKKIVDTKISQLEHRLDDPLMPISNEHEITKVKKTINMLKISQDNEYKNIFEFINASDILVALDSKVYNLNKEELEAIQQSTAFHNGKSNSNIELIRSSMIYLNMLFNNPLNITDLYAESILDITTQFFSDEMNVINKEENILTFNKTHIEKAYTLKSTSDKVQIFIYSNKPSPLDEIIEIGFDSLAGIKNKFELDNPSEDEISNYTIAKNILNTLKNDLNFDKNDIRTLKYFITLLEKGNIPSSHFVK